MTSVSVIIPVFNQAFSLAVTLFGYTRQVLPIDQGEIIVVDDGSTEPIEPIVESYRDQLNLKYIRIEHSGRAAARNIGAAEARGEILIFSDADRIPAPTFVHEHVTAQERTKGAFVVGEIREIYVSNAEQNRNYIQQNYLNTRRTRVPQYCKLIYSLFDEQGHACTGIPWVAALSGNMSIPLEAFEIIDRFDENFVEWGFEHIEFGYRAHLDKLPFFFASEATNVHIAHRRNQANYKELMKKSHEYFFSKHRSFVVKKFLDFMLGEIGITQLEHAAHSYILPERDDPNHYVRVTNF